MTVLQERPAGTSAARRAMIDSQLRVSGVTDPVVLGAMLRVPREDFVPAAARDVAYIDRAVPLGDGRFLAAPLVHGRMLAEAAPTLSDHVLVVSGGSGYLAALVTPLVASCVSVDAAAAIAPARDAAGAFTLILVDGAIEALPASLVARLAEGGRIVTGVAERGVTRLAVGRRIAGTVALLPLTDLGIPVLPEFAARRGWSF